MSEWTRNERIRILIKWVLGGTSLEEFAEAEGLPPEMLLRWYTSECAGGLFEGCAPVERPTAGREQDVSRIPIPLRFGHTFFFEFESLPPVDYVAAFLRAVGQMQSSYKVWTGDLDLDGTGGCDD